MLLNQTSEYALRLMSVLATHPPRRLTSAELAEAANVPAPYVAKVMRKLVVAGLVDGVKGHHGGFLLARTADTISFLDVLESVGLEVDRSRCAFGLGTCNPSRPCMLHPALSVMNESVTEWARTTSLASVSEVQGRRGGFIG